MNAAHITEQKGSRGLYLQKIKKEKLYFQLMTPEKNRELGVAAHLIHYIYNNYDNKRSVGVEWDR